jgi:hypothetical protein
MTAAFLFGLIAIAAVLANIAIRDHRRAVNARRVLFNDCRGVLDDERWDAGGDGFPSIEGTAEGRAVVAKLIPDTMVMRRLPQLWLSVTLLDARPGAPSLSLIARHSGNEFYTATLDLPGRVEPPAGLPLDVLIRGDGARAEALCQRLGPVFATILEDARVKEIAVTARGVRIIRQVAEGSRGEHLLLRQVVFGEAAVARDMFVQTLDDASRLLAKRVASLEERAA